MSFSLSANGHFDDPNHEHAFRKELVALFRRHGQSVSTTYYGSQSYSGNLHSEEAAADHGVIAAPVATPLTVAAAHLHQTTDEGVTVHEHASDGPHSHDEDVVIPVQSSVSDASHAEAPSVAEAAVPLHSVPAGTSVADSAALTGNDNVGTYSEQSGSQGGFLTE